jgi:endoglucanase
MGAKNTDPRSCVNNYMKRLLPALFLFLLVVSCSGPVGIKPDSIIKIIQTSTATPTSAPTSAPTPASTATPTATPDPGIEMQRGINLANMLEAPQEGELGLTVHQEYFGLIRSAGFDFVRVPIRWDTHAEMTTPYTIDASFFNRIDQVVGWALDNKLVVILDFHNYGGIMTDPANNKKRFIGIWKQIAEHYKDYPPQVLFELLNEPNDWLNASVWNQYLRETLNTIRITNPARDVVIDDAQSSSYDWISTLDLPDDPHLIATFHYYEPFQFTHQGADWVGQDTRSWLGTTWQGSDAEKARVTANFDQVAEWANQHQVRVLLGEFGAYSTAELASRIRWTRFVAQEAERHGFAWAYWEFAAGFGVYDPVKLQWREALLNALIPQVKAGSAEATRGYLQAP